MAYPKYGSIEWEREYLKNRKKDLKWDFKALREIHTRHADGKFVMAKCKKTGKWITGEYPVGGFRYMLTLDAALRFNGVWRTEEDAKKFVESRNDKYGNDTSCGEVEFLHKTSTDEDIIETLTAGNLKI